MDRAVKITIDLKKKGGPKLKDFRDMLNKEVSRSIARVMQEGLLQ